MENTSKALLIAAAVVLVIILIAFGMKVLTTPKDSIDQAQGVGDSISDASQTALGKLQASLNKGGSGGTTESTHELISTTQTYIGYYADIDNNGSVDGIIYADLAEGSSGKKWTDNSGKYSWDKKTNLDDYYISQEKYTDKNFGERSVIVPENKEDENDRFYVMALTDYNPETTYRWYGNARGKLGSDTSVNFGTGKNNTSTMMNKVYGDGLKNIDVWANISSEVVEAGWFVPSRGEWSAFANELDITSENYVNYELHSYWSSSQNSSDRAWYISFYYASMELNYLDMGRCYVRLSTTF